MATVANSPASRTLSLLFIVAVSSIILRLPFLSYFPLNDGGLHVTIVEEMVAHGGYGLPLITSYNNIDAPVAYPPLAYYLTLIIHRVTGASVPTLVAVLPWLFNVACIPLFFGVARAYLSEGFALLGTLIYALLRESVEWQVMGGGVTRALGCACILALIVSLRRYSERATIKRGIVCGILVGLGALSHPSTAVLGFLLIPSFVFFEETSWRERIKRTAFVGLVAIIVISPWLGTVLLHHGVRPFLYAASTGKPDEAITKIFIVDKDNYLGLLAFIGLLYSLIVRRYRSFAVVFIASFIMDARGNLHIYGSIFYALFASFLFYDFRESTRAVVRIGLPLLLLLHLWIRYQDVVILSLPPSAATLFRSLNRDPKQRYLIVSSVVRVGDTEIELFPWLSGQTSITTHQGTEWIGLFKERLKSVMEISRICEGGALKHLKEYVNHNQLAFDRLYVSRRGCPRLVPALLEDTTLTLVTSLDDAYVLERTQ
jgi:4-amino-4-deoxy-L-arabinose transferase-like glycosyltransferase